MGKRNTSKMKAAPAQKSRLLLRVKRYQVSTSSPVVLLLSTQQLMKSPEEILDPRFRLPITQSPRISIQLCAHSRYRTMTAWSLLAIVAQRPPMKVMLSMRVETGTPLSQFDLVDRHKKTEQTLEDAEARVCLPRWRVLD